MLRSPRGSTLLGILVLLLALPSVALGWGYSVHRLINRAATTHLPSAFSGFAQWADDLESLATAADERKCCVPGESIKHYIDIDDYPEFFAGTLPHSYSAMVAMYGESRVLGNGTVPWAIEAAYAQLVTHFANHAWDDAVAVAADIGHYVGDSHNPMHLTLNYNGQLTGQHGIHSRHESQMTSQHLAELEPAPGLATSMADPLEAVFDWIDVVYPGVEEILAADLVATQAAGGSTSSGTYYARLWQEIGPETTVWIRDASLALAGMWYTAWLQAGSPALPGDPSDVDNPPSAWETRVIANVPNPFNPSTQLRFELASAGSAMLQVVDAGGRIVWSRPLGFRQAGFHSLEWDGTDQQGRRLASGVYRIVVTDGNGHSASGSAVLLK